MAKKVSYSTLNATTLDIMNVIRQNASYDYQQNVPKVTKATDIPKVGEVIYGTPAFANQFINALVNRIASVRVQSATFNNPYAILKKGYLEFGETVEDIFVNIAKAVDYSPEKGEAREFKRTLPDVRSAFHTMNWRVMYPVTIQDEDLRQAFLSLDGVTDLIAKIVDQVYTAAEYDEFLLFKYLLIKGINAGSMYNETIDATDMKKVATSFRAASNLLPFMSSEYNVAHVKTTTPKDRQVIFMDAKFNAQFDVEVLASAFNMDKADFMGRLYLIDNWDSFDNDRFDVIRANSDGISEITTDELTALKNVKAVLLDENWFQVYDNNNKFTEKYVASGLYWNYFYHTWKTVSYSPFANCVVFTTNNTTAPTATTISVTGKDTDKDSGATVLTFSAPEGTEFVQTNKLTTGGVAVQKYGALIIPSTSTNTEADIEVKYLGTEYKGSGTTKLSELEVGTSITVNKA